MPKKICNAPGCNTLVSMKERYCKEHSKELSSLSAKDYNKNRRNKEHQKFHNSKAWKELRKLVLSRSGGLCVICLKLDMQTKADVVDHIIPLTHDYSKRLKIENLQPLCHACHNRKTAEDLKLYGGRV